MNRLLFQMMMTLDLLFSYVLVVLYGNYLVCRIKLISRSGHWSCCSKTFCNCAEDGKNNFGKCLETNVWP